VIEDLGSTNGTFINGQRLTGSRRLQDGDTVRMGGTTLEFVGDRDATRIITTPPAVAPAPAREPVQPPAAPPPAPPYLVPPAQAQAVGPYPTASPPPGQQQAAYPQPAYAAPGYPPQPRSGSGMPRWIPIAIAIAVIALLAGAGGYLLRGGSTTPPPSNGLGGGTGQGGQGGPTGSSGGTAVEAPSDCGANVGGGQTIGYVAYVESNRATPNGNSVMLMPYSPDMTPLAASQCPTGGSGSADLTDSGVLDADNQVLLSPDHSLLLAVNQGSDTIAVFHVGANGALTAVNGSPFSSGGMAPASLGISGDVLVVANKAQDGIRNLSTVAPTYTTMRIGADGSLSQIANSAVSAAAGSSPTDAYVPPGSKVAFSTEESGPMRGFSVDANGVLVQAPNSPISPDAAIFGSGFNPAKEFGLGIGAHPSAKVVYIGMPTVPAIAVYSYDDTGVLTFVKSVPETGAYLPCWIVVTSDGKWAYVANAATDNVTAFAVSDPLNPRQVQTLAFAAPGNPWNETIDPTGKYLFVNTPRDTPAVPEGEGNTQHVMSIGTDGQLTEVSGSPVNFPIAQGHNPQGVAVVAIGK